MSASQIINPKLGAVWATLTIIFVLAPLVVVAAVSFTSADYISFPWDEGFSLRWYKAIPSEGDFLMASVHSLVLAALASIAAVLIGSLGAMAIVRGRFRGRGFVTLLGTSPLFVPQIMTGLAIALALAISGIATGLPLLLVGHLVVTIPYVIRVVSATLIGLNPNLEWAAMNLGASKTRVAVSVIFPQVLPALTAAGLMAAIVSIENISLSIFLSGPNYEVLPVYLYNYVSEEFTPIAASVSVCLVLATLLGMLLIEKVVGLDKAFGGDVNSSGKK